MYNDISFPGKKVFDEKDQVNGRESKTYSIPSGPPELNYLLSRELRVIEPRHKNIPVGEQMDGLSG